MAETIKILFFGDITGKPGRLAVKEFMEKKPNIADFVIANVENASHGFGLTQKNYEELTKYGINCLTSGNHIWDKKDIFSYIDEADKLLRPANYPEDTKGSGYKIFETEKCKIGVINLLGTTFMPTINNPMPVLKKAIEELKRETNLIFVDFHAEATAEKICYGRFCAQNGVSFFAGTHTHVQTADEQILNEQTAYITDAGFCGDTGGVIGMSYETSLNRILTMLPERYEISNTGESCINGVLVSADVNTGKAVDIKRIFEKYITQGKQSEN